MQYFYKTYKCFVVALNGDKVFGALAKRLLATEKHLLATATRLLATATRLLATEKRLLATEKRLLATAKHLLATEKRLLGTEKGLLATAKRLILHESLCGEENGKNIHLGRKVDHAIHRIIIRKVTIAIWWTLSTVSTTCHYLALMYRKSIPDAKQVYFSQSDTILFSKEWY